MHSNNRWLKTLLYDRQLSRQLVAALLLVDNSTVDRWLQPRMKNKVKNTTYRHMPDMAVALLKYRLADPEVNI